MQNLPRVTQKRREIVIIYYLLGWAFRLQDVTARAHRASVKLGLAPKNICSCELTPWGRNHHRVKGIAYRKYRKGIRTHVK